MSTPAHEPWSGAQARLRAAGLDGLLIAAPGSAAAIGGHRRIGVRQADPPTPSLVLGPIGAPHVCTPDPDGALHLPAAHVHPHWFDAHSLARRLPDWLPGARRVAMDSRDEATIALVRNALHGAEVIDAAPLGIGMWRASTAPGPPRDRHAPAAVAALHDGYVCTEAAVFAWLAALHAGVSERDAAFALDAAGADHGLPVPHIEHVVAVSARHAAEAPWLRGDFANAWPWRQLTTARRLVPGDLAHVDAGFLYDGWVTDLGCTLVIGRDPTSSEAALAADWRAVADRVTAAACAGATAADLRAAALTEWTDEHAPWPDGLYVAHAVGDGSVTPPFVGTDLGVTAERSMVLRTGDVLMIEPFVWRDGVGGFRAERCVLIGDDGATVWSSPRLEDFVRVG